MLVNYYRQKEVIPSGRIVAPLKFNHLGRQGSIESRYYDERKQTSLSKMTPPLNMTIAEIARAGGISEQTLNT